MLFINLTARKPNGDFCVTSTDVLRECYGVAEDALISTIEAMAKDYKAQGYEVELVREWL